MHCAFLVSTSKVRLGRQIEVFRIERALVALDLNIGESSALFPVD